MVLVSGIVFVPVSVFFITCAGAQIKGNHIKNKQNVIK